MLTKYNHKNKLNIKLFNKNKQEEKVLENVFNNSVIQIWLLSYKNVTAVIF